MPASAASWPRMLNHAVNQPQPVPLRRLAQWYIAPDVGIADASSAMLSATARVKTLPSSHQNVSSASRHITSPSDSSVTASVRMEMIEKEIAKSYLREMLP